VLAAPVIYLDKVEAVIVAVDHGADRVFSMDDHDVLMMLGTSTGVLLHHSYILKDAIWASRLADATGRLIKGLSNPYVTLSQVVAEVTKDSSLLVPCADATLYLVDYIKRELWTFDEEGTFANEAKVIAEKSLDSATDHTSCVARSGKPYLGEASQNDADVIRTTVFAFSSMVSIPVFGHAIDTAASASKTVVAVMQLKNKTDL
jgi:hypothetical protein